MNQRDQDDPSEPQLPAKLSEDLKSLYAPRVIPSRADDAILAIAREHLAGVAPDRRIVLFPRWLAAAAAVVVLTAVLGSLLFSNRRLPEVTREDINRDGRVDVLDAFALARRLQQGMATDRLFDINGDGVVDQKDIAAITARAVKLDGRHG